MTQIEQITAIHNYLRRIFIPGDLIEIRGLKSTQGTLRFLGDELGEAAKAASGMEKLGADVYYCINPVSRESRYALTATHNKAMRYIPTGGTVGDKDIDARNIYFIDIDPERPTGTAASAEMRRDAMATSQRVHTFLAERGWPEPLVLDSGNGIHMLYRGSRCSADGSTVNFALKRLNSLFGGGCKIDSAVSNPSRIARMPLCLNKKAGRVAQIVYVPEKFEELPHHLVLRLAEEEETYRPPSWFGSKPSSSSAKGSLVIDEEGVMDLIDEFPDQLELDRDPSYHGDATYFALAKCPFKGDAHIGQGVGMGKTTIILRPDSIGFKCFSGDCTGHSFVDLLRLLYKQTGRRYSGEIWADDPEALDQRWGCAIEDVTGGSMTEEEPVESLLARVHSDPGALRVMAESLSDDYYRVFCALTGCVMVEEATFSA